MLFNKFPKKIVVAILANGALGRRLRMTT